MGTPPSLADALDRRPRASLAILVTAIVSVGCADTASDPLQPDVLTLDRTARAASSGFSDGFETFDLSRWSTEEHALGRGFFRTQNVREATGSVSLILPADAYDGGEIRSVDRFGYGTYVIRMQAPVAPGSITAFFLYEGRYRSDEIDIEIINDGTRRVLLTTWVRGRMTNHVMTTLPLDPAGVREYVIDWSSSRVRFYQNSEVLHEFRSGVPRSPMHLMASAWWPTWLSGPKPTSDLVAVIDHIEAAPR